MKNLLSLLLALSFLFTFFSCKKESNSFAETSNTPKSSTIASTESTSSLEGTSSFEGTSSLEETSSIPENSSAISTSSKHESSSSAPKNTNTSSTSSKPESSSILPESSSKPETITITDAEALACLDLVAISDDNYSDDFDNNTFRFAYDFIIFDKSNAKYEISSVSVVSATVYNGKKCDILQPTSAAKINKIVASATDGEPINLFLSSNGYSSAKTVCRVISPELNLDNDYNDFVIEVKVSFKNGIVKTVKYTGSQGYGIGGPALWALSDSDFMD